MILGIGIDIIDIERFADWHTYSPRRLSRVFSANEQDYCRSVTAKSAERFAARFAAKEALYKALSPYALTPPPLLLFCTKTEITSGPTGPRMSIEPTFLQNHYQPIVLPAKIFLSLSHAKTSACAMIALESAT